MRSLVEGLYLYIRLVQMIYQKRKTDWEKRHINMLKLVRVCAAVYLDIKGKRSRYLESHRSYMARKFEQLVIRRKLGTS